MFDIEHYYEAKSVEDAVRLLSEHEDAEIISGGTDVLVKLRDGKGAGGTLVSIHEIPSLHGVYVQPDGTLEIRPATCFTDLTYHPLIQKYVPYLGEAVDTVGGPQVRNQGTIGGNICNGATSADSAATMQTLNAVVVLQGVDGVRTSGGLCRLHGLLYEVRQARCHGDRDPWLLRQSQAGSEREHDRGSENRVRRRRADAHTLPEYRGGACRKERGRRGNL